MVGVSDGKNADEDSSADVGHGQNSIDDLGGTPDDGVRWLAYPCGACCEGSSVQMAEGTSPGFAWHGPCAAASPAAPIDSRSSISVRRTMNRPFCATNSCARSFMGWNRLPSLRGANRGFWYISRNLLAALAVVPRGSPPEATHAE